eukprot:6110733-Amphidinium_carterae.1
MRECLAERGTMRMRAAPEHGGHPRDAHAPGPPALQHQPAAGSLHELASTTTRSGAEEELDEFDLEMDLDLAGPLLP